jgi:hypothetical protein
MWAILDRDEKTVIGVIPPDADFEKALKEVDGRTLIEMTIDNSPAYVKGEYIDGKFYPPKEIMNA